jgi:transglutaminase-like putative cysteine protease
LENKWQYAFMFGVEMSAMTDFESALKPTFFLDSGNPLIAEFIKEHVRGAETSLEAAVKLFYAVRDGVAYDLLKVDLIASEFKASKTLARGFGYCIHKAVLLAACCRAKGIPCRLRFADVRNHLTTDWLQELMGTDLFIYHGYVEMFLADGWVKSTPAFDRRLCERSGVRPIEFDGIHDAVFHEFDVEHQKHMEYVRDHGVFDDLPYDEIVAAFKATYPKIYEMNVRNA